MLIYNTQTRQKEPFSTLTPGQVKMYCCGVTVYDYCHLGHARSYIVWDVIRRYLTWRGYQVTYIQNFTDIDDKILTRAQREGVSMTEISERYIQAYFEDARRLNIQEATNYPRVTEHISQIHQLIQELEKKGYTYNVNGDVYYKVNQFQDYGKLSGRHLEQMQMGASGRLSELDTDKKQHSSDFVLWKAAKADEPSWDSPWGSGRPGWHIECSAMVRSLLGETIDIHGGGGDLVFPHHENEIAQSEAVTGQLLARYWLHNGMVRVNGEKMAKSTGNFTTIRDLLNRPLDPMVLRLFVLQAHYRKPLDFTEAAIDSARNSWNTLQQGLLWGNSDQDELYLDISPFSDSISRFQAVMDDDFNTAAALAVIFELAKDVRREKINKQENLQKWQTLVYLAKILGLEANPEPENLSASLPETAIQDLIFQRNSARKAKNYPESDRLREQLKMMGVTLVDLPDGQTQWYPTEKKDNTPEIKDFFAK